MGIWTAILSSVLLCLRHVFDRWIYGTMLHRALARVLYIPSIAKMLATSWWKLNPAKQWYNRLDETVILGALPFRSQTKEVKMGGWDFQRPLPLFSRRPLWVWFLCACVCVFVECVCVFLCVYGVAIALLPLMCTHVQCCRMYL